VDQWRATANAIINVGCEVLTALVMKNTIFWDITLFFFFDLLFDPVDGGNMLPRNVV
jgi:hypothetical protein